ncbi:hypothetical protein [uncultured Duncaniella sp.]|uniref:hypothetical protein n=1 Tax=uncultured Duncaniella sp. TaxID=2768039 RepID=UPI002598522A|nr:hypothetical protein [uncultured Duncaniella sp.]
METITIQIFQADVYAEVAKATDYTGSKLIDGDENARDRILAADDDLAELGRFWEESVLATNENFKEMLVSGKTKQIAVSSSLIDPILPPVEPIQPFNPDIAVQSVAAPAVTLPLSKPGYEAVIEVSKSFDKTLTASVQSTLRSYFIASIIGQWFKFANKGEAKDYFMQASEMLETAERLLYSRRKPTRPND